MQPRAISEISSGLTKTIFRSPCLCSSGFLEKSFLLLVSESPDAPINRKSSPAINANFGPNFANSKPAHAGPATNENSSRTDSIDRAELSSLLSGRERPQRVRVKLPIFAKDAPEEAAKNKIKIIEDELNSMSAHIERM